MSFKRIKGQTYYLLGAVNTGLYLFDEKRAIMIDTGLYESNGERLLSLLYEMGITPYYLFITHGHVDHFGSTSYLKREVSLKVLASPFTATMVENPLLEPLCLYSAEPFEDLRRSSLMGESTVIDLTIEEGEELEGVKVVSLPGHAPGQIGLITPDGVFFTADAFFGEKIVEKYPLLYFSHIHRAQKTWEKIASSSVDYFVPGHGPLMEDPLLVLEKNRLSLETISQTILHYIKDTPMSREKILQALHEDLAITPRLYSYFLNHSIISAHLGSLFDRGEISYFFEEHTMLWRRN